MRDEMPPENRARAGWWSAFWQDVRYALRGLRRNPGFAAAVILTLGLGLGANATTFRIVDRLLLRPPAYLKDPARMRRLYFATSARGTETVTSIIGYRTFLDLRENLASFDDLTPFYTNRFAIGRGDAARERRVGVSGAGLWRMFDVTPVLGRFFTDAEDTPPTGADVVVLSYAFWQSEYGGRSDIVGTPLDIGRARYAVIGVAPEGFTGFSPDPVAAFIPVSGDFGRQAPIDPRNPWYQTYRMAWLDVFGHAKPGVSTAKGDVDLTHAYQASYERRLEVAGGAGSLARVRPRAFAGPVLRDRGPSTGTMARIALWLAGVAAIVLLIACANVANLLLTRGLRRQREIAVRIALGVSRRRLLTQLLTESLVLTILGGLAGVAIAQAGGGIVRRVLLDETAPPTNAFTDPRLLAVIAVLVITAALVTGLAPAFRATRADVARALKAGARERTGHRSRLRPALLVAQIALSVVLLVGAGLFLRSFSRVQHVPLGYDADRLLWVEFHDRGTTLDSTQAVTLREQLVAQGGGLPGVERAARALTAPFWSTWRVPLHVEGLDSLSELGPFTLQAGSPELFATMGTHILRGRGFEPRDREHAPPVMVVSESMARRLWPNGDAIGKCVRVNSETNPCATIIGIAEDVRRRSLSEPEMQLYLPIEQFARSDGGIFIRTRGSAAEQADAVRRSLQPLAPGASYVTATAMSTILAPKVRSWRVGAAMFTTFGALALVVAAIGLYGVIAYDASQRRHELGVRMVLGAERGQVVQLIVRDGLMLVVSGIALGTVVALLAARWVSPLLFDVSASDPPVIAGVVAVLIAVGIAASWIPAARAAQLDPSEALRAD